MSLFRPLRYYTIDLTANFSISNVILMFECVFVLHIHFLMACVFNSRGSNNNGSREGELENLIEDETFS